MRPWVLCVLVACEQSPKKPPAPVPVVVHDARETPRPEPTCVRRYKAWMSSCTGVPDQAGHYEVEVCDECADDTQCTWKSGGKCSEVGDNICFGPRRWICKYPEPSCGNKICPEPEYTLPPAAAHGSEPPPAPR